VARPRKRTPELREQVIGSAVELLARDGVAGFTARRIAAAASTSTPAVYELFGDKSGLVREIFFAGFELLGERLREAPVCDGPREDLLALVDAYRAFLREQPVLAEVMFSRPFSDFDPQPAEARASAAVRELIVARVERALHASGAAADPTDAAHGLVALVQGLGAAERAGRLGTSRASVERRWTLALDSLLGGLGV
jgi:AcrR family transcriptional regulator